MRKASLFIQALSIIAATQVMGLICWNLVPRLAPLLLDQAGAAPSVISWTIGTLPQMITLLLTPIVSIWSDNHRSLWGRRRPFLWWSTPLFCMALLGIHLASANDALLSCALILFALCALIPTTLVFYIVPETIPMNYIGRFTAWNGALSSLCAALFNYFGLAWCTRHSLAATIMAIAIYSLAMISLTVIPKSDSIKAPPESSKKSILKIWQLGKSCAKECFGDSKYVLIFLCLGCNQASMILRSLFGILFSTKEIGMEIEKFGRISGICACTGAATAILAGRYVDRHSPLTFFLHGSLLVIAISLAGYFFVHSATSYLIVTILTTTCYSIQSIAYTPLLVTIFPKEKYGQFSSINTTVCTLMVMAGSALGGWLTDYMGYRFMFLWDFILTSIGTVFLLKLKRIYTAAKTPATIS